MGTFSEAAKNDMLDAITVDKLLCTPPILGQVALLMNLVEVTLHMLARLLFTTLRAGPYGHYSPM